MELPRDLALTAEDIRYLRPAQLSTLTNIQPNCFSAWSATRRMSEASLKAIAEALSVDREEVLKGFDLRREDYVLAKTAQKKALRLKAYLQPKQESA